MDDDGLVVFRDLEINPHVAGAVTVELFPVALDLAEFRPRRIVLDALEVLGFTWNSLSTSSCSRVGNCEISAALISLKMTWNTPQCVVSRPFRQGGKSGFIRRAGGAGSFSLASRSIDSNW